MRPAGRIMSSIVTLIMCIVVLACIFLMYTSIKQPKNYTERIKLETSNAFDNNCVIDELGWFDNSRNTAASIQKFWKETGVQPYIILRADDGTLTTDAEKDAWLQDYYQTNIAPREDAFVYCYFYENGEESSGIPSYMGYTSGYQASSVMDAEAVDIFWGYIDRYWVSDMSTDDMFIQAFNNTGKVIMKVSTTGKDLVKYLIVLVITVIVSVVLLKLAKVWFKDRREKAKEDERVLNTKVSDMAKPTDPLEDKYLN